MRYFRPISQVGPARPPGAKRLAGGWAWFTHIEVLERGQSPEVMPVEECAPADLAPLTAPRPPNAGLAFSSPRLMGILNVTPDSFSDGGLHDSVDAALTHALGLAQAGADIIDIGGESTRPGAVEVDLGEEIARTIPVIKAASDRGFQTPISIDTRKAPVARAALEAGASLVNDVSGFSFDPDLAPLCATLSAPVCVMHMQGDPSTMQDNPDYDDVLLDVYDALADRIGALERTGVPRTRIIADPGIGFGKTQTHNLAILERISLFHGLGVPILLGVSRKGMIGRIGLEPDPACRMPGSVALGLAALGQGVQMLRVHDVSDTRQAIALWRAAMAINPI
ncbi:MAG: dihydropteroate synthase [Pseudomonadota bacterium]